MALLSQRLSELSDLNKDQIAQMYSSFRKLQFRKDTLIPYAGQVIPTIYFLEDGLWRIYHNLEYGEYTYQVQESGFAPVGPFLPNSSQLSPTIHCLESCTVYQLFIDSDFFKHNWKLRFLLSLVDMDYQILLGRLAILSQTPENRFISTFPKLPIPFQIAYNQYIASYIHMSTRHFARLKASFIRSKH